MNEHVKYGLDLYVADTNPQCAILIKGDWGCGKTHFVKEWMNEKKQTDSSACDVVYVTLFGLSTIKGLKEAINKALSPIMYKIEKYGKDFFKAAAKVVLKCDSPISDIKDVKFQYELNPLDLLYQLNFAENSKEYKLFVFDDVERCDIPLKELFGFVDYLFEQVGSRVVLIVGNTDMQPDNWKEELRKHQEKIIGREYEIIADVNTAVGVFIDEIKENHPLSYSFLKRHQDAIVLVWDASQFKNLRSIRQCIRSFSEVFEPLNDGADDIKLQFFLNYLAFGLEYYNGDKNLLLDIETHQIALYVNNTPCPARTMIDKYIVVWQKLNCRLFDVDYLGDIKASIMEGKDISDILNLRIQSIVEQSLFEKLKNIIHLENSDVDALIREAKGYLQTPITNVVDYLYVVYDLCFWESKSVCILKKSFERDCLMQIEQWLKKNQNPMQIASLEKQLQHGLSIMNREGVIPRFEWLHEQILTLIDKMKGEIKEPIFNQLEKLSNSNIDETIHLMFQVDIYGHANYSSQALFNRLNVNHFCQGIRNLNNKNKMNLAEALDVRYRQNYNASDYLKIFGDEEEAIKNIINILEHQKLRATKMTRHAYEQLIKPLNHALERFHIVPNKDSR